MLFYVFCALFSSTNAESEDSEVLQLTDLTFGQALSAQTYTFVHFYAPWCAHCKYLKPQFAKAATELRALAPTVALAELDATANPLTVEHYNITGYPTVKLFLDGQCFHYSGGRMSESLVNWVLKRVRPSMRWLAHLAEAQEFTEGRDLAFLLFAAEDSAAAREFERAVEATEGDYYAVSNDRATAEHYNVKFPGLLCVKNHDARQALFTGRLTEGEISEFIRTHELRWVMPFNDKVVNFVFGFKNPALFLFRDDDEDELYQGILEDTAQESLGTLLITYTDLYTTLNKKFAESLGVSPKDMPIALILDKHFERFLLQKEITAENLVAFIKQWKSGQLSLYLKSEPLPAAPAKKLVRTLVGKNFKEIVLSKTDVLVYFYSPWCGHCKTLGPEISSVAAYFKGTDSVIVASMDATKNEVEGEFIEKFPTIQLYPANHKRPVEYDGPREASNIIQFLIEYAEIPIQLSHKDIDKNSL